MSVGAKLLKGIVVKMVDRPPSSSGSLAAASAEIIAPLHQSSTVAVTSQDSASVPIVPLDVNPPVEVHVTSDSTSSSATTTASTSSSSASIPSTSTSQRNEGLEVIIFFDSRDMISV